MKLLYVIHQYFPECFSGTEQYCLAASREARRRGDEVIVLSLHGNHMQEEPPIEVHDRPYDGFSVLRMRHWQGLAANEVLWDYENPHLEEPFRQVLDDVQPDAVHFFHLRRLGANLISVARERGVPTVVNLMDYWYLCPRFTLLRSDGTLCSGPPDGGLGCVPCEYPDLRETASGLTSESAAALAASTVTDAEPTSRLAAVLRRSTVLFGRLAEADTVIAPSRFLANMFEQNGFPRDRMRVVPYGLEPGRVQRIEVDRPRSPLRVGFAGVFSPWKAPHLAVEAVRQIEGPLKLTMHGRTEEPMFADYIEPLLERAAGDPRIEFPGPFDRDGVSRVLADLDLLLVTSTWYENTPFVILEAMEAGLPVIAADLGGMSEIIEDGVNGFLFESGNATALAAVLRRCIDNPQLIAQLHPQPPSSIADNYDAFLEAYRGRARA